MREFWLLMGPAVMAASVMSPVHALFGLHIVRRGLIFIDLAVAQVAALGMSIAICLGHAPDSPIAYQYSIAAALVGALLISLSRFRLGRVPHEALIGVVYVLGTAASIILLEFAPSGHGLEELKGILAGNILFVQNREVMQTAIVYGIVMVLTLAFWKPISQITLAKAGTHDGLRSVLWDFAFYSLLGFVVASSVKIAGVLVVFTWLVMPAVIAFFFVEKMSVAAMIAVPLGILGSAIGLVLSYMAPAITFGIHHDHPAGVEPAGASGWPSGPSIVVALGAAVVIAYFVRFLIPDKTRGSSPSASIPEP